MADYDYVTTTGVILPDTASILGDVQQEYRDVFGQDLEVGSDTPQGVLIAAEVSARSAVARNNATLANQINPNEAGGTFLDAVCALLGVERQQATKTLMTAVVLGGRPLTYVPKGVRAKTDAGDLFESVAAVTLDATGAAKVDFRAIATGPVTCALNTLSNVVDTVLGWETVNNPGPTQATVGKAQQSDMSLRDLRRRTLANQGISTVEAQVSNMYLVSGVRSLQFRENVAATTQTIDGITMVAHSVWMCVEGGLNADVALSLLTNKTDGAAWNGATTVDVVEPNSKQTYTVKFDRPTSVPMLARVTVSRGSDLSDPQITVRDAILKYANGDMDNERGFVVGGAVSPFELAAAINFYQPGMLVRKVEVTKASTPTAWTTDTIAMTLTELATIIAGSITVNVV